MPQISVVARPAIAVLGLLLVACAASVLAVASSARAAVSITVSPAIVHADSAIVISGTKDPAGTVAVELRPPGSSWIALACSGADAGSSAWSCSPPGPRPLGNHQIQVTETIDGHPTTNVAKFETVPYAVGGDAAPPPPPPPPPSPTVTPTVTPSATPTPDVTPSPTVTGAPGAKPVVTDDPDVELDTFALPVETPTPTLAPVAVAAPSPAEPASSGGTSRPVADSPGDPTAPSVLDGAVTTLQEIVRNPLTIAVAAGLGGLILLLVAIPANILDATIEAN